MIIFHRNDAECRKAGKFRISYINGSFFDECTICAAEISINELQRKIDSARKTFAEVKRIVAEQEQSERINPRDNCIICDINLNLNNWPNEAQTLRIKKCRTCVKTERYWA